MPRVESLEEEEGASCSAKQRVYAICKKATALAAVQDVAKAAREIQQACRLSCFEGEGWQQIVEAGQLLSFGWQAQHWARLIAGAEKPNPLSSRDGKLLRRVPLEGRLDHAEIARNLEAVLPSTLKQESIQLLLQAWSTGKLPGRATLALMRSYAYLQGCRWDQALKDAKFAAAYGPQANGSSCWPSALAAIAAAIEGNQSDNTQAALFMQRALELDPSHDLYAADLERLLRRIPEQHAHALQAGGSEALEALLAQEREEALPEYRRQRPKYYYYYKWMRGRVTQHCGELPAPVMDKVLHIDANELDMLLTYPKGIQRQAANLLDIYNSEDAAAFAAYRLPLLTWRESEALKAEHAQSALDAPKGTPTQALQGMGSIEEKDDDLDALEPIDDL